MKIAGFAWTKTFFDTLRISSNKGTWISQKIVILHNKNICFKGVWYIVKISYDNTFVVYWESFTFEPLIFQHLFSSRNIFDLELLFVGTVSSFDTEAVKKKRARLLAMILRLFWFNTFGSQEKRESRVERKKS